MNAGSMSKPEWDLLLALRAAGLSLGEAEYRFHPVRRWRFDRAWPERKVAIEIEGGVYARKGAKRCPMCKQMPSGRHTTGAGFREDIDKYNAAQALGWTVFRVTPDRIGVGVDLVRPFLIREAA